MRCMYHQFGRRFCGRAQCGKSCWRLCATVWQRPNGFAPARHRNETGRLPITGRGQVSMAKTVRVKSFELIARDIADVDVHLLHVLSIGVGWPHRPADWEFLRQVGQGIVAVDDIGRVFCSAMWFLQGEDLATIGLVITTPRAQAQGAGRWLMEEVMERCKGRNLTLNSTKAAYPLYLSLGFEKEATAPTSSRWSPTARRCSASAISARWPPSR
jgi:GNAT superfamily N-acetyltransferase